MSNFPKRPKRLVFPENGQVLDRIESMSSEELTSPNESGFYTPKATIINENGHIFESRLAKNSINENTKSTESRKNPPSQSVNDFALKNPPNFSKMRENSSFGSLNEARVQFALSQTPPMSTTGRSIANQNKTNQNTPGANTTSHNTLSPVIQCFTKEHRGELNISEKYNYDLSKAQLKASSRTSALLSGFAMVCLVELQYADNTPKCLLVAIGVVTSLLVSVHLLALMMSTCILPYMEATGCTQDSPHIKLKFYIDLSWIFSTCIGLLLFLVEIGLIFWMKFNAVGSPEITLVSTAILVPVGCVFVIFSYLIHKSRVSHSLGRFKDKVDTMKHFLDIESSLPKSVIAPSIHDV